MCIKVCECGLRLLSMSNGFHTFSATISYSIRMGEREREEEKLLEEIRYHTAAAVLMEMFGVYMCKLIH